MDRESRGVSIIDLPANFTVIDLETTGLDAKYCDIIELAAIKVSHSVIVDKFNSLVHIDEELDPFIVQLTGITDEMLENAPTLEDILPKYIDFIGEDIVVGHNVGFDVNFIYDNLYKVNGNYFKNDWINTIRLCKKIYPEFNHYGLGDLVNKLNIETTGSHRALADCETYLKLYEMCRNQVEEKFSSFDDFYSLFKKRRSKRRYIDINSILAQTDSFDETHPLFGQECVFTGKLEKMKRADAMQIVVNLGGTVKNGITNNTNFLVLGNNDFCKSIKDGKSNKHKEAEQLKLQGKDIEIISEQTFYEMLDL